jgi:hypothetical protein
LRLSRRIDLEGIHPETHGIMGVAGHWAIEQPIAKGKVVNFNYLIEPRFSDFDPSSANMGLLDKVKVTKIS